MSNPAFKIIIKKTIPIIVFICGITTCVLAQETSNDPGNSGYLESSDTPETKKEAVAAPRENVPQLPAAKKADLSELQSQARFYRNQGLELQRIGELDGAITFYQKAINLDPAYAVAYNDLGIIYEAKGFLDRAEESYLKAIKIDPNYLSVYSNLALLYETEHALEKAAFYWGKRAGLGPPNDPWTQKAKSRLEDIRLVSGKRPNVFSKEQEIIEFMQDVSANLDKIKKENAQKLKTVKQDNQDIAKNYFEKAKISYAKGEYVVALKEAMEAQQLDPSNKQVNTFIEELQRRLLSR